MRSNSQGLTLTDSVYERLLSERIIFLGSEVNDEIANRLCAQILLLAAGTKGKRYALPHARILMHQPLGGVTGSAADIAIQAEQFAVIKKEMFRLNAEFTGQPIERIEADSDRDRWFTAQEALEYGFVDHIITRAAHITNGEAQ